jgi:hypothetical protein
MAGMIANCKIEAVRVVDSASGKHRGNSPSETKIQRHEFDRVVVHGIFWLRSDDG